jgi:hypothetical protein
MLTTFIVGVDVQSASSAEADTLFTQAQRLYSAGLLLLLSRNYQDINGSLMQSFTGTVTAQAAGYVAQLARERVVLSREPLP